ncbi:MAG: Rieske 2Fe-2S domain-containing protein [Chloroflexota bacterium]|nr:Rieske 2Fe-2S domain-containing protein [Chloroflexota bacterium]
MATHATSKATNPRLVQARLWTHLVLALGTLAGYGIALVYDPSAILAEPLALGLGYIALLYLAVSLLIGPLYLARQRRNPVNLYLRRDIGIWAGVTALLHVVFSLQIYDQGGLLGYFVPQIGDQVAQGSLFIASNVVGLLATVLITVLLLLSNDRSLRWLKGPQWKRIQRWAYPLMGLTILHTLGYQLYNERDSPFFATLGALSLLVGLVQGTGLLVHRRRAQQRTRPTPSVPSAAWVAAAPDDMSRRRFLLLGGATLVAGVAGLVSFKVTQAVLPPYKPSVAGPVAATAPAVADNNPGNPATPTSPADPPTPSVADNSPGSDAVPTASAAEPPTPPVADTLPAPAPPAAPPSGFVISTLTDCPVNSSVTFIAPDTGASAILVHEADGSVKAFSNVCTHRPYPVQYDANSQLLVCPLHQACFNAQNGVVTRGPARRTLPTMPVHVDTQGNILYG